MSSRLTDEPPHHRPGYVWPAEQVAFAEAYHAAVEAGGIASGLVLVFTKHGINGTAGFLRDAKYHRAQLAKAASDLKRVGGFDDLARLTAVAATLKPKGPPTFDQRMAAKRKRRSFQK
jgi:hypothetical protein